MASFGEKLRQAREAKNISLQELAASTKIGTRTLQALEDGRFELLPGGIFNKGFVRSYAREVGLDEEETVAEFLRADSGGATETNLDILATQVETARGAQRGGGPSAATLVGILAVLVALALGGLWLRQHRRETREQADEERHRVEQAAAQEAAAQSALLRQQQALQAAQTPPAADPNATAPAATNAANATTPQTTTTPPNTAPVTATPAPKPVPVPAPVVAGTSGGPLQIVIAAKSRAWISVLRDDRPAETLTMDPANPEATTRSYSATQRIRLIVGNPGGVQVTFNGKPAGSLGRAGQRSTVTFTAEGVSVQQAPPQSAAPAATTAPAEKP